MSSETIQLKLKRDSYMSTRGGTSAFFNIYCAKCRNWLLTYQKDGPGNLHRLYCDRIHASASGLPTGSSQKGLTCPGAKCSNSIGVHMIYKPENRSAFRLVPGSIVKKKSTGILPAPQTLNVNTPGDSTDETPPESS